MSRKLTSVEIEQILDQPEASARVLAAHFGGTTRRIELVRRNHGQISPRFVTADERARIRDLSSRGVPHSQIAATVSRATSTVRIILAAQRVDIERE